VSILPRGGLVSLRSRDFRLLLFGQALSLTGSQMQHVAVVWQLYLFTRSPLALGLLGLFRIIPVVFFALGGGVIADAFDRRRLMMVSQSLLASVSLAFAALTFLGWANAYTTYGLTFIAGSALAIDSPARQALIPRLMPREHLVNGLSLHTMVWQVATIVGPALAGWMLAANWLVAIYVLDALSFLAVIGALIAMEHRAPMRSGSSLSLRSALDGISFMRRAPLIWSTMLLDFVATFFGGSMLLMPIFADQILQVGPKGLGLLYSAQPIGAALAAATLSAFRPPRHQGAAVLWAVVAYGASVFLFGISRLFWLSLIALAASGGADSVSTVIRQTLRQMLTPDHLRGRMTSINMIFFVGGPQLGEVEAGMVAKAFGARASVASGGALCMLAAAVVALAAPSLRRYQPPAVAIDSPLSPR
jgi:MFS family permease